ncbi:MAG: lipopolysaccharide biosynthesis protein [Clostridia bacterium]|nr:lipopolysaccharide biosynthesis protein [Clostridia bacterium]
MVNILFCGNCGVFDGMLTCALSILKRSPSREPYTFYIYTMDVSYLKPNYTPVPESMTAFLERVVREYNPENRVVRVDVTEFYKAEFTGCPNEQTSYSPYAILRLFADAVEGMPDKLLYLDADIMFNRDIHLLYDIDVDGYEYAAARDHYGKYLINFNYINSGVLLLNLKRIRETGLFAKARAMIKTKKILFVDQTAVYKSTTRKKMLPQRFNDQKFLHKHTVVRHFSKRLFWLPYPHTDNIKQWHVSRVHKTFRYYVFDDILYEYIYLKKLYERSIQQ